MAASRIAVVFAVCLLFPGIFAGCSDSKKEQEQREIRQERERERIERERIERERREAEERAQACDKAKVLSERAGRKIVNGFLGGRDIRVNTKSCEYNSYDKKFRTKIEIYWNGSINRENQYNIDGVLTFNADGSNAEFAQTYANDNVKELSFFRTIVGGVIALGILANENANHGSATGQSGSGVPIYVDNKCSKPIRIAIHYKRADSDTWELKYWWDFDAGEKAKLTSGSNNEALKTKIADIYFYAEAKDKSVYWRGSGDDDLSLSVGEKMYKFRKRIDQDTSRTTISLSCS